MAKDDGEQPSRWAPLRVPRLLRLADKSRGPGGRRLMCLSWTINAQTLASKLFWAVFTPADRLWRIYLFVLLDCTLFCLFSNFILFVLSSRPIDVMAAKPTIFNHSNTHQFINIFFCLFPLKLKKKGKYGIKF